MNKLSQKLVDQVRRELSGARLAKFNDSIAILNESLQQDQWVPRGKVKAESGFYQGISKIDFQKDYGARKQTAQNAAWYLMMTLNYGQRFRSNQLEVAIKILREYAEAKTYSMMRGRTSLKVSDDLIRAWVALCEEKTRAIEALDDARPKPKITKIGLSPKVTKTLTEMDLQIDINSIRMAPIAFAWVQAQDKNGAIIWDGDKPRMEKFYYIKWPRGTRFNMTRFSYSMGCEACGKNIPSGMFVPVLARDVRKNERRQSTGSRLIGMYLGCDCARNIFGIQDVGVGVPGRKHEKSGK